MALESSNRPNVSLKKKRISLLYRERSSRTEHSSLTASIIRGSYLRAIKELQKTNKVLALAIQKSKVKESRNKRFLEDYAKVINNMMFSRAKLLQSVQNTKQILTDLEETLLYLEIPSGPIPFVLNGIYRSDYKNHTIELNPINELISESSEKNEIHSDDHKQEKEKCILPINENEVNSNQHASNNLYQNAPENIIQASRYETGNYSNGNTIQVISKPSRIDVRVSEAPMHHQSKRKSVSEIRWTYDFPELDDIEDEIFMFSKKQNSNSTLQRHPSLGNINTQQMNQEMLQPKSEVRSNSEPLKSKTINTIKRTKASSNCSTALAPAKNPSQISAVNKLESDYDNGSCGDETRRRLRTSKVKSYKEQPLNCKLRRPW